jgi:hypothetical protein
MNDEVRVLRERIAVLERHIAAGINCGFFCALPECAKFLSGEQCDQDATSQARTEVVERAACGQTNEPGQCSEVAPGR